MLTRTLWRLDHRPVCEIEQVQVSQQRVKAKADEHGILLRPSDPNLAVARQQVRGSRTPSAILGGGVGGGKVSRLGTGQSSGKSSDPLARKVKVRKRKNEQPALNYRTLGTTKTRDSNKKKSHVKKERVWTISCEWTAIAPGL